MFEGRERRGCDVFAFDHGNLHGWGPQRDFGGGCDAVVSRCAFGGIERHHHTKFEIHEHHEPTQFDEKIEGPRWHWAQKEEEEEQQPEQPPEQSPEQQQPEQQQPEQQQPEEPRRTNPPQQSNVEQQWCQQWCFFSLVVVEQQQQQQQRCGFIFVEHACRSIHLGRGGLPRDVVRSNVLPIWFHCVGIDRRHSPRIVGFEF